MVSDKPLHGKPKLAKSSKVFYDNGKETHIKIAIKAVNSLVKAKKTHLNDFGFGLNSESQLDSVMW